MKRKNSTINVSKIIFVVLVVSFFSIVIKLAFISLAPKTDGIDLKAFVENRNTEKEILKAKRGNIYSVDGSIMAQSVNSYTLIAYLEETRTKDPENPQHVVDKEGTAKALAPIIGASEEYILNQLNQDLYQVQFGSYGLNLNSLTKKH